MKPPCENFHNIDRNTTGKFGGNLWLTGALEKLFEETAFKYIYHNEKKKFHSSELRHYWGKITQNQPVPNNNGIAWTYSMNIQYAMWVTNIICQRLKMNINSSQNMKTLLMIKCIIWFLQQITSETYWWHCELLQFVLETLFFVIRV